MKIFEISWKIQPRKNNIETKSCSRIIEEHVIDFFL